MSHSHKPKARYEYNPHAAQYVHADRGAKVHSDPTPYLDYSIEATAATAHAADDGARPGRATVRSVPALAEQRAKRKRSVLWLADEDPDTVLELDPFLKERGAPHGYVKANTPAKRMKRTRKGNVVPVPQPPTLIDRATAPGRIAADVSLLLQHAARCIEAMPQGIEAQAWCFDEFLAAGRLHRDGHFDLARAHADSVIMVATGEYRKGSDYGDQSRKKRPVAIAGYAALAH